MKVRRQVESDGKMRPIGGLYDDDTPNDVRRSRLRRFRRTMKQVVRALIKGNDAEEREGERLFFAQERT